MVILEIPMSAAIYVCFGLFTSGELEKTGGRFALRYSHEQGI